MKKFFIALISLAILTGCGADKQKVKDFAEKFASYVNTEQMDSVKALYPTINFNAMNKIPTASIEVKKKNGNYQVIFSPTESIEVGKFGNGDLSVVGSKGIAVFPKEKLKLAEGTGMVKEGMNDVEIQDLLNDKGYFQWLNKKYFADGEYKIKIIPGKIRFSYPRNVEAVKGVITITLENLSDTPISGKDYTISYTAYESNGVTDYTRRYYNRQKRVNGKDLEPKGSTTLTLTAWETFKFFNFKIVPAPGKEALLSYDFHPTGKEYEEYLETHPKTAKSTSGVYNTPQEYIEAWQADFPTGGDLSQFEWLSNYKLKSGDLDGFTLEQYRLLRNAIFALHGYSFKSEDLQEYFGNFSGYEAVTTNVTDFNKTEQANISLIKSFE